MFKHTLHWKLHKKGRLLCLHSVYPVPVKMYYKMKYIMNSIQMYAMKLYSFGSRGRAHPACAPLKLKKIRFFGIKSWFFTRNTPKIFVPHSARCNFFKFAPSLTWNPGSVPAMHIHKMYPVYIRTKPSNPTHQTFPK